MNWRPLLALALLAAAPLRGQTAVDTPEPGYREAVAAATTEPRFLSPWVADLPDHPRVPSPKDHLGHIAGAPGELSRTAKSYGYYRALAAATDRVKVDVIVLINPVAEPDGRDRAVDWYYRHLKGKTDFDNLPPRTPPYWGKYVFHDNTATACSASWP